MTITIPVITIIGALTMVPILSAAEPTVLITGSAVECALGKKQRTHVTVLVFDRTKDRALDQAVSAMAEPFNGSADQIQETQKFLDRASTLAQMLKTTSPMRRTRTDSKGNFRLEIPYRPDILVIGYDEREGFSWYWTFLRRHLAPSETSVTIELSFNDCSAFTRL